MRPVCRHWHLRIVYPAAGFVESVTDHADTMLFNLEVPQEPSAFEQIILGPATRTIPNWTRAVLAA